MTDRPKGFTTEWPWGDTYPIGRIAAHYGMPWVSCAAFVDWHLQRDFAYIGITHPSWMDLPDEAQHWLFGVVYRLRLQWIGEKV